MAPWPALGGLYHLNSSPPYELVFIQHLGVYHLIVEQNLPMALRVSDYVYVLSNGEIVYQCTPVELSNNKEIQGKYLAVESASTNKR